MIREVGGVDYDSQLRLAVIRSFMWRSACHLISCYLNAPLRFPELTNTYRCSCKSGYTCLHVSCSEAVCKDVRSHLHNSRVCCVFSYGPEGCVVFTADGDPLRIRSSSEPGVGVQ